MGRKCMRRNSLRSSNLIIYLFYWLKGRLIQVVVMTLVDDCRMIELKVQRRCQLVFDSAVVVQWLMDRAINFEKWNGFRWYVWSQVADSPEKWLELIPASGWKVIATYQEALDFLTQNSLFQSDIGHLCEPILKRIHCTRLVSLS